MRVVAVIGLIIVATIAAALAGCSNDPPGYRYKLAIEVVVGGEVKRAFNVVDIRFVKKSFPDKHTNIVVTGEAIYLDLGTGRRPLIALLTAQDKPGEGMRRKGWGRQDPGAVIGRAFAGEPELKDRRVEGGIKVFAGRGPKEIAPADLPDLVTFADISEPKSVIAVDPGDLAATLGPGVAWGRLTIEITDEPITTGIEQRLPWLKGLGGGYLDGAHVSKSRELSNTLHAGDFKKGK